MASPPPLPNFCVVSWNCNGLFQKLEELRDFCVEQSPQVLLIQETRLPRKRRSLVIDGYAHYFSFRNSPPSSGQTFGGTALYIKNCIPHHPLPSIDTNIIENTLVEVNMPGCPAFVIGSAYARHRGAAHMFDDLTKIFNFTSRAIIFGDFNAHHTSWNCRRNNPYGVSITDFAAREGIIVAAPLTPTHFSHHATPSIIDLALIKNLNYNFTAETLNVLSSDHLPVKLNLNLNSALPAPAPLSRVDWRSFKTNLNNSDLFIPKLCTVEDVDAAVEKFTTAVHHALAESTTYYKRPPPLKLPHRIKSLIKRRNDMRGLWQRTRYPPLKTELNALCRKIRNEIKILKNDRWTDTISALSAEDNSIWDLTRKLKNSHHSVPPLTTPNGPVYSNADKVEALASHFESQFAPNEDIFCDDTMEEVAEVNELFLNTPPSFPITPTLPSEIREHIRALKPNKSPGPDKITNRAIQNFPLNVIIFLSYLFNAVFKLHYFPSEWKKAIVVPIHKPGEDPTLPASYRPISLLSGVGKLAERLILRRLNSFLEDHDIIIPEQFGFRKQHSTTQQLLRVVEHISSALANKMSAGAVFFDISKAFDRVWGPGLIYKLIQLHIPDSIIHLIHSYLRARLFMVRLHLTLSNYKRILGSVVQGSQLGPILFSLYINDIPRHGANFLFVFADDTAIMNAHKNLQYLIRNLQHHIDLLEEWFVRWRLRLNANKSHFVLFTRKRATPPPLYIGSRQIKREPSVKYLGVVLDQRLSWNLHVKKAIAKFHMVRARLAPLLYSPQLSRKNKALLYLTVLRPTLLYACPVWSYANKTIRKRIQITENKTLRGISKAPRYKRNACVRKEFNIKPISDEMKRLAMNFFQQIPNVRNELLFNMEIYDPREPRSRKRPRAILVVSD